MVCRLPLGGTRNHARHRGPATGVPRAPSGFSLLELLVVLSIIVTVLGLSSLGLQGMNRDRQGALAEIRGVLESARATAIARHTDVYVAFATDQPADPDHRFRRYAMFTPDPGQPPDAPDAGHIFLRKLVAISEWHGLPDGLLFASGPEIDGGEGYATIIDAPAEFRRLFPYETANVAMPFLLFNAHGKLEVPPLFGERFHNVGVVEAAYQPGVSAYAGVPDRIYLGWQQSQGRKVPRVSCLTIDPFSGRPAILLN
jgi:prepilin-type N-terminal cleavage/methylation domain-containing protein